MALFAAGCAKHGTTDVPLYQIPWPDGAGHYSLQKVPIFAFDQPQTLQSRFLRVFVNPFVSEGRLASETPVGRFIRNRDGVFIPSDYASLQAAAIQAHFERLEALDNQLGIALKWPMKIGIQANVSNRETRESVLDNAIFDIGLDALLIVPYSGKNLPIALNAGILAHEHFHMIFQSVVQNRLKSKGQFSKLSASLFERDDWNGLAADDKPTAPVPDKPVEAKPVNAAASGVYNLFLLRALNEGLADFWGWVYTADNDFIGHSLPSETGRRRMDLKTRGLKTGGEVRGVVFKDTPSGDEPYEKSVLVGRAYAIGTDYARFLREVAVSSSADRGASFESRVKAAKMLIDALPAIADAFLDAEEKQGFVAADVLIRSLFEKLSDKASPACRVFQRALVPEGESKPIECPKESREEAAAETPPNEPVINEKPGSKP